MSKTIEEQIASIERELGIRKTVYPRWVQFGRLKQEEADHEIACMEATLETLKTVQPNLFNQNEKS